MPFKNYVCLRTWVDVAAGLEGGVRTMRAVWCLLLGFAACLSVWAGENSAARQNLVELLLACRDGDCYSVRALLHKDNSLARQALTTDQHEPGFTPLAVAASGAYAEIVRLLLEAGADVNGRSGPTAVTPLLQVCMQGHTSNAELPPNLVRVRSERPGTAKAEASHNTTATCPHNYMHCLHTLINSGAALDACDSQGCCALYHCAKRGDAQSLCVLTEHGAKVDGWPSDTNDPLCAAALNGHMACVRTLISAGAPILTGKMHGYSALSSAAQNGHVEILQYLLQQGISANAEVTPNGGTPLLMASLDGQLDCMRVLLAAGADIDRPNDKGYTPLYGAAWAGQLAALELLLASGAKVKEWSCSANDPLCIAASKGYLACVQALTSAGNPIITDRTYDYSALHSAAENGHVEVLQYLLQCLLQQGISADTESLPNAGTPLLIASQEGHLACINALLDAGCDINRSNEYGRTALYYAAKEGHLAALELLLASGANTQHWSSHQSDPLCTAALNGHMACVRALVSAGAPIVTGSTHGFSALNDAAQNGHVEILQYLLQQGISANAESSPARGTPLLVACQQGQLTCLRTLLNAGADINRPDNTGCTALYYAAKEGRLAALEILLNRGAKVQVWSSDKSDPLCIAAFNGHRFCVRLLLAAGSPIITGKPHGFSALCCAAQKGYPEILGLLLQQGVSANAKGSPSGGVPLISASINERLSCIRMLLAAGADVNRTNDSDRTALYFAAEQGKPEAVALLLAAKARVDHRDSAGQTALWAACEQGHEKVVARLLAAGANPRITVQAVTPLCRAAQRGHPKVVEQLLAAGVNPLQNTHLSLSLALPKPKVTDQKPPTHNAKQEDQECYAEIEVARMLQQVRISPKDLKMSNGDK